MLVMSPGSAEELAMVLILDPAETRDRAESVVANLGRAGVKDRAVRGADSRP